MFSHLAYIPELYQFKTMYTRPIIGVQTIRSSHVTWSTVCQGYTGIQNSNIHTERKLERVKSTHALHMVQSTERWWGHGYHNEISGPVCWRYSFISGTRDKFVAERWATAALLLKQPFLGPQYSVYPNRGPHYSKMNDKLYHKLYFILSSFFKRSFHEYLRELTVNGVASFTGRDPFKETVHVPLRAWHPHTIRGWCVEVTSTKYSKYHRAPCCNFILFYEMLIWGNIGWFISCCLPMNSQNHNRKHSGQLSLFWSTLRVPLRIHVSWCSVWSLGYY